jgi:hypothetical protein
MRVWLARVHHDLVKRLLWPARDRRDVGGKPKPGELVPQLVDDEGAPVTALALWSALRAEIPAGAPAAALDLFAQRLESAVAAAHAGDVDGVLALDGAFRALSEALRKEA